MQLITQHPKQLWVINFGAMWNAFSYYGTQTILVLYLMHVFQLDRAQSYLLYGAYAVFVYTTPLLGGVIADKWLGCKAIIISGAIFNILGNFLLISTHRYLFSLGLALTLVGAGFYSSNISNLVGSLYANGDAKKETGYTLYYLAINIGGTLAPLVYGAIIYFLSWNLVFLCNIITIGLGLSIFLINLKSFPKKNLTHPHTKKITKLLVGIVITLILLAISLIFYFFNCINFVVCLLFFFSILYIISIIILKYKGQIRNHLFLLLSLSFFSTFYFAAGLQVGTTITLFIQQKINSGVIDFQLPASTFSTLYCLFVVLLAPFMTITWKYLRKRNIVLNPIVKLSAGIFLAAIGMSIFAITALTNFILTGISIGYLFLSAGELIMSPAIYTAISDLAPRGMKSTMMGSWTLFVALGGYFSSVLATVAHVTAIKFPLLHSFYFTQFAMIAAFTLIISIVSILAIPVLAKLLYSDKKNVELSSKYQFVQ